MRLSSRSRSNCPAIRLPKPGAKPKADLVVLVTSDSLMQKVAAFDMTSGKPVDVHAVNRYRDEYTYVIRKKDLANGHHYVIVAKNSSSYTEESTQFSSFTIADTKEGAVPKNMYAMHKSDISFVPTVMVIDPGQPYRGTAPNNNKIYFNGYTSSAISSISLVDEDFMVYPAKSLVTGPTAWSCYFQVGPTAPRWFYLSVSNTGGDHFDGEYYL